MSVLNRSTGYQTNRDIPQIDFVEPQSGYWTIWGNLADHTDVSNLQEQTILFHAPPKVLHFSSSIKHLSSSPLNTMIQPSCTPTPSSAVQTPSTHFGVLYQFFVLYPLSLLALPPVGIHSFMLSMTIHDFKYLYQIILQIKQYHIVHILEVGHV